MVTFLQRTFTSLAHTHAGVHKWLKFASFHSAGHSLRSRRLAERYANQKYGTLQN